jgi:hypothetical protein
LSARAAAGAGLAAALTLAAGGLAGSALVPGRAAAAGACETVRHAGARRDASRTRRAPLIVGDSTMLLATPYLGPLGIEADARGCRQFAAGVDLLERRLHAHTLPPVVVLALGSNGAIGEREVARALRVAGPYRVVGFVTPAKVGAGSTAAMRNAARRHPDRVFVLDWQSYGHRAGGGVFAGDGLHVSDHGARVFARFVRRRLEPFARPPRALRIPASSAGARACATVRRHGRGPTLDVLVLRGSPRVLCALARRVARRDGLRGIAGWRWYDPRHSGRRPFDDVYVRADRRVVVATRRR